MTAGCVRPPLSSRIGPLIADKVRMRRSPDAGDTLRRNLRPSADRTFSTAGALLRKNFRAWILRYVCNVAADSKRSRKALARLTRDLSRRGLGIGIRRRTNDLRAGVLTLSFAKASAIARIFGRPIGPDRVRSLTSPVSIRQPLAVAKRLTNSRLIQARTRCETRGIPVRLGASVSKGFRYRQRLPAFRQQTCYPFSSRRFWVEGGYR
jgi:hypothetical protein